VENGPLGHVGRWLVDERGRVVILRGVNLTNKLPPYHAGALGFDERHAAQLALEGFNAARIGIIWKALEPEPGAYDDAYLEQVARIAALLGAAGLRVVVDFHQDLWNERFGGEGAPDWTLPRRGLPAVPNVGFPGNYAVMPALWRAYDRFWANAPGPGGVGLQDRFAAAWRHVAERLRDEPHVVAYDILNEPFPGSAVFGVIVPALARRFDRALESFHRRVTQAIRAADRRALVFCEPGMLFGLGRDPGAPADERAGLSFHAYCAAAAPGLPALPRRLRDSLCPRQLNRTLARADAHARRHGVALLLSEFGATDDLALLRAAVDVADRWLASWLYWAYWNRDPGRERPEEGIVHDLRRPPTPDNLKGEKLDVLARPYPFAVAGTPLRIAFRSAARELELVYATRAPGGARAPEGAPTEVAVPARQFREGFEVEAEGAGVELPARGGSVLLHAEPATERVRIRLRPRRAEVG
jgi:endoglycosylceramidase